LTKEYFIAGIDYSLSSPAITLGFNSKIHCFFFVNNQKKIPSQLSFGQFELHPTIKKTFEGNQLERYKYLSSWTVEIFDEYKIETAYIEDYSFGSSGSSVLNIAENCGIMKYRLQSSLGVEINLVSPKSIKKFASGSGNANKEQMETNFIQETQFNIRDVLNQTTKQMNPSSDIIDSYFIYRYGLVDKQMAQSICIQSPGKLNLL
jgi:Holliday junction resolvasome RuvABC endonuclease subunit